MTQITSKTHPLGYSGFVDFSDGEAVPKVWHWNGTFQAEEVRLEE